MPKIADSLKSMCDSVDKMKSACADGNMSWLPKYRVTPIIDPEPSKKSGSNNGKPQQKSSGVKIDPEKLKRAQEQAAATRRLMGFED